MATYYVIQAEEANAYHKIMDMRDTSETVDGCLFDHDTMKYLKTHSKIHVAPLGE